MKSAKETLIRDIEARLAGCRLRARQNYVATFAIMTIAVSASIVTAVSVAAEWLPKELTAAFAALPAVAVGLMAAFKFEARYRWWFTKAAKLDALRRGLLHEGQEEAKISREMSDFLVKHEEAWPGFGKVPGSVASENAT